MPVEGPYHQVIERHRAYGTQWGTQELVAVLLHGASVAGKEAPGAPLRIGNLSKKNGGDIRWSRSHNSGRDADTAFYVKRIDNGQSVVSPELLQFDERGVPVGRPDLIFDVHRNWLFIKGLVTNPDNVTIQYVFVSQPLKDMLVNHAFELGESPDVIARAADVLHQPTDALPHDDHFHVRIACPREDRLRGCLDGGPQWAWADWHEDAFLAQAVSLASAWGTANVERQLDILNFLEEVRSPFAADVALGFGAWSQDPGVKARAFEVASNSWGWSNYGLAQLERLIQAPQTSPDEMTVAYNILKRSQSEDAREFALRRLLSPDATESERTLAARSLGHFMDERLVPVLLDEIVTQPPLVRDEIAQVLRRIMNYGPDVDWKAAQPEARERAAKQWRAWAVEHGNQRLNWLVAGLRQQGVQVSGISATEVDTLMELLPGGSEHLVYNVNRMLREVTGRWAPLDVSDGKRVHDYWSGWWKKNRARILSSEPPKKIE